MKTIVTKIPSREAFLKGEDTLKFGYPWLTYSAIIALEEVIKPDFKILEFGSGGSTVFFADNAKSVFSFESNENFISTEKAQAQGLLYNINKLKQSEEIAINSNFYTNNSIKSFFNFKAGLGHIYKSFLFVFCESYCNKSKNNKDLSSDKIM